jgi:ribose transport system permease protein
MSSGSTKAHDAAWPSWLRLSPPLIALLLAVGLFFAGGLIRPNFVNPDQALNIVRLAAFLGIIAAGQTLVIISGGEGIDLSVGAVLTLGAILTFMVSGGSSAMLPIGVLTALGAGMVIGVLNGLGIVFLGIPPLVMTLGMTGVVQGAILAITQGEIPGATPPVLATLISGRLLGIPGVMYLWVVLAALMWFMLARTPYGRYLFAVGVNRRTARLSGVNVALVVTLTYGLSGMLAAFVGGLALLLGPLGVPSSPYELLAAAALAMAWTVYTRPSRHDIDGALAALQEGDDHG